MNQKLDIYKHVYFPVSEGKLDEVREELSELDLISYISYRVDSGEQNTEISVMSRSMDPDSNERKEIKQAKQEMLGRLVAIGVISDTMSSDIVSNDVDVINLYIDG